MRFTSSEQGGRRSSRSNNAGSHRSESREFGKNSRRAPERTSGNRWQRSSSDDDGRATKSHFTGGFNEQHYGERKGNSSWNDGGQRQRKPYGRNNFRRQSAEKNAAPLKEDEGIRLNRYIANAGVCSRRDAEQYITAGVITINGKVVTELATKVHYGDVVKFNNAPLMPEKKTYILLNKPKDYVTTTDDPHAEKTVMDLIGDAGKNRVYPVGRLDRATTGLLLLTNDGDLAEHLCHPRYNKQKIYQVTLDKKVTVEDIDKLLSGIELEDGPAKADDVEYSNPDDKCEVGVVIHIGRNRVVRRMFEHLGYKVKKLDRVYYAGLTKKNLPRGKWRFLTDSEVAMLKRGAYK